MTDPTLTEGSARPSLCYLSVSYAADIERFALLRHSMALFSSGIEHIVYVHTEDLGLFQRRFGQDRGVTILPFADLLPTRLERMRQFWRRFGRIIKDRIAWRFFLRVNFTGWKLQQIVKLLAATRVPHEAFVILDSDEFLCGRVTAEDFFDGSKLILLEAPAATYQSLAYEAYRQVLVGGWFSDRAECFQYIHTPRRFLRRTAERLLAHLEATHRDWQREFIAAPLPSEYQLLGWCARTLEGRDGYRLRSDPPEQWAYYAMNETDIEPTLALCRAERGRRKFFVIQSNIGDFGYIPRARALIEELAAL